MRHFILKFHSVWSLAMLLIIIIIIIYVCNYNISKELRR